MQWFLSILYLWWSSLKIIGFTNRGGNDSGSNPNGFWFSRVWFRPTFLFWFSESDFDSNNFDSDSGLILMNLITFLRILVMNLAILILNQNRRQDFWFQFDSDCFDSDSGFWFRRTFDSDSIWLRIHWLRIKARPPPVLCHGPRHGPLGPSWSASRLPF